MGRTSKQIQLTDSEGEPTNFAKPSYISVIGESLKTLISQI